MQVVDQIIQSGLTVVAFAVLRRFGLVADVPLWIFALLTAVAAVIGHTTYLWLRNATEGPRLHLRIATNMATTTAVMYATGWGPMLALGYLLGVGRNLQVSGSRAARPCAVWLVAGIVAGQCAIAAGAAPSLAAAPGVHGLAALAALGLVFTTLLLGSMKRNQEAAEARLRQQAAWGETLLRDISDIGEGMIMVEDDRFIYANDAYRRLTGYGDDELGALPSILELIPAEERTVLLERRARRGRGEPLPPSEETVLVAKDGHRVDVEFSVQATPSNGTTRLIAVVRDITERKRTQTRFEGLLQAAPDAMVGASSDGTIAFVNDQVAELFGYQPEELLGRSVEILVPDSAKRVHPGHRGRYVTSPQARPMGAGLKLFGRRKDGAEFPAEISLSSMGIADGLVVIAAIRDVTARRAMETALAARVGELAAIAATDPLTALPNRREFERILVQPRSAAFAVLAIDVDQLKPINDFYGHEAGDAHLRTVAEALRMGMRDGDALARVGGDEFVMLLPQTGLGDAAAVAHRLRRTMHGVTVPHGQARISIGCAAGSAEAEGLTVWAAADNAMYRAKQLGRDRVELSPEDAATTYSTSLARWEPILRSLLRDPIIVPAFQPIVGFRDRAIHGYEALARLPGMPAGASVEALFATAQRLGMHRDLDWVCRRAAVQGAHHLPPSCPLFINVGASALLDPVHGVDQLLLLLRWARRSPNDLVLEITEREAVRDLNRLREVLGEYRSHGVRFALDDVGEGFSTFEVLATATPEFVKISAKLTRQADCRGPQAAIRSLVAFAEATSTNVIAEGVESDDDARRMSDLGVTLGQGFALGRPETAAPPTDEASCPRQAAR